FVWIGGIRGGAISFIALTALTSRMGYKLAWEWGIDERAAIASPSIFALHWIPPRFGGTVYPRNVAMACVVAAALIADRWPFAAGALAGLAFADRFSEIVFLIPLLLIAQNRLKVIGGAIVTIAITVGVYDWITWGSPFA